MPDDPRFPLTAAQLIGNFCETLFCGIYLATCAFAARTLLLTGRGRDERWLRLDEIRWLLVFFALSFFAVLTFDAPIGLYHNYMAFIVSRSPDGPIDEFLNLHDWVNIVRSTTQCVSMVLGDFVLIYRCWVVYKRRWLVILAPGTIFLGSLATSIRIVQLEIEPATVKDATLNNSHDVSGWIISLYTLAAAQNILSTGLLIFRIWRVDHDLDSYSGVSSTTKKHQPRHLRKVIIILAESGAFYTMTVVLSLILVLVKSDGFYPMSDVCLQSTGIVFNVILVRASTVRDRQFSTYHPEQSTFHAAAQPETLVSNSSINHTHTDNTFTAISSDSAFKYMQTNVYSPDVSTMSNMSSKGV